MLKRFSAASILDDMCNFFARFPEFEKGKNSTTSHVTFTHNFAEKSLKILVTTPVIMRGDTPKLEKFISIHIKVVHKTGASLELTTTRAVGKWRETLTEKILVLRDLIEDIGKCPRCGEYYYPQYNKEIQANPKGTWHVILVCPKGCGNFTTTFHSPKRIKTRLHRYIKKPY